MNIPARERQDILDDIGTLWTLRRSGHSARCALMAIAGKWEPRVIVDGTIILAERCPRGAEVFALIERWKRRMLDDGWRQVVPTAPTQLRGRYIATRRHLASVSSENDG
jgi:hypothetical protein